MRGGTSWHLRDLIVLDIAGNDIHVVDYGYGCTSGPGSCGGGAL